MRQRTLAAVLTTLLVAAVAGAQQVQVREEMLPNGMKLLLVERHDSPTVSCGFVARVGGVNEPQGITGISHMLEHMMFKGTKAIGTSDWPRNEAIIKQQDEVRAEMEKEYVVLREKLRRGEISGNIHDDANATPRLKELKARYDTLVEEEKAVVVKDELDQLYTEQGGSGLNAGTSEDQTFYFITVPSNKLELWFWLESDRLLNPVFREFYSERDVIREERRLSVESTPTGQQEEAFEAMFWQASPYAHGVIGWPSDIESYTRAQAARYFATFYAPNNITAALVGDFKADEALALAQKYFGRIPRGQVPPPEMVTQEMPQLAEKRMFVEADTNPEVSIRYHTVAFNHPDGFALQVLASVLNRRTGRLYKSLVEGKQLAVGEPGGFARGMKYEGYFEVSAEIKDGVEPKAVEDGLLAELDKLVKEPVADNELQKVKNQILADSYRRLGSNFFLLLQLLLYDSNGGWQYLNDSPAKLLAVTAADVQRVAKTYLTPDKKSVLTMVRKAGSAPEDPELAALPAEMKAGVKQQLAAIAQVQDRAQLEQMLGMFQQRAGQVPPQVKPAFDIILKKLQQRIEELSGGAAKPAPGKEK